MSSSNSVTALAASVKEIIPKLGMGHTLSKSARNLLENLASRAGLSESFMSKALDNDLISIYLVALKDGDAAKCVVQKINMRLDDTLLGLPGTAAPKARDTYTGPTRTPATTGPTWIDEIHVVEEPYMPSLDAIRDMIVTEVREGALEPLQHAMETLAEETGEALSTHGRNLLELREKLTDDFADMAYAAAVEALKSLTPTRLEIARNTAGPTISLGLVHRDTAKIINVLSAGVNVYLHGPAGSGKTTVARKCAEAFSLQFYFAAKVESEYQLIGFKDAKGDTVRTQFREAYEHGGVFLFDEMDEMDASSPAAVVAMNAALANGVCPFPDGIVQRHADFHVIGAGNTKLTGANRQYAGRNQLDAASIDRFAFIEFGYDDELERALATDLAWCSYVQRVRAAVAERGLNHLVTPRATYDGCKLLAGGFDWDYVARMCVYKGLDDDTMGQIERIARKA